MNENILNHYLNFSVFTNPGCYENFLKSLPDDVKQLWNLISHQIIHRVTLRDLNTNANKNLIYWDMEKFPWHRLRCEDDILPNSVSMIAELLRLDDKWFHKDRKVEDKIVVTCRYVAILMATILKSKNIPCRVRSWFAPYFSDWSWDHWINQYWDQNQKKWINFDADWFFEDFLDFDQYNIPEEKFDWSANTWLWIRQWKLNADNFINAWGYKWLLPVLWAVFYDFHSLMNNEILYLQAPYYIWNKFDKFTEKDFEEIDELANLMLEVDKNFDKLVDIWNTNKKFRILNSPLIWDDDHIIWK